MFFFVYLVLIVRSLCGGPCVKPPVGWLVLLCLSTQGVQCLNKNILVINTIIISLILCETTIKNIIIGSDDKYPHTDPHKLHGLCNNRQQVITSNPYTTRKHVHDLQLRKYAQILFYDISGACEKYQMPRYFLLLLFAFYSPSVQSVWFF